MVCRNLTGIYPCAVSGFIAVAICLSHKLFITHQLLAFPNEHLRCHIPVGDGVALARIVVMVLLKAHIVQLADLAFLHRSHHQHLVDVFQWVWGFFPCKIAVRIVDCGFFVISLIQGVFLVDNAMFEAVEQVVFFAACRIHFDRVMRLGRAAVSFEICIFFFYTVIVPHDIDLHELAGFEAVAIAAASGVCFVQRVGRSCLCGIHHAKVWHRRQQHRKRKQHRQQLFFQSSSCFHNSSYCFSFFISKKKAQESLLRFFRKKGCWDGHRPSMSGCQRLFQKPDAIFHFSLCKVMKKQHPFDTAFSFIVCLPEHKAFVVGFRSLALIERILPVSRCDAREVDEACFASALLNHLVDIVSDVRLIQF